MKKLLLPLLVLLIAAPALAQETYSIPATAQEVTDLTAIVAAANGRTCMRVNLAEGCTQAQACTAANAVGGASCTAAQARAANARIYPATQSGREEFVRFRWVQDNFQNSSAALPAYDRKKMCEWWATATQPQKDTACTSVGRTAGCRICP